GLRPVLHLHQRRPRQQHGVDGHGHLPQRVLPLRPRRSRGAVRRAAGGARRAERPAVAGSQGRRQMRRTGSDSATSAFAVLSVFPLLWSGWSSLKGQPGSGQTSGYGFGNYSRMAHFGEGLTAYLTNSLLVSVMTVAGTLVVSALGGYAFARFAFPGK